MKWQFRNYSMVKSLAVAEGERWMGSSDVGPERNAGRILASALAGEAGKMLGVLLPYPAGPALQ